MKKSKNEIAQSLTLLVLIILSGGLQDAYSYFCRDGVFANAQTGNVVFLSVSIVGGNPNGVVKYLVPVVFFTLGAILAKVLYFVLEKKNFIFWKQAVLIVESVALFAVGFFPQSMNLYANALVSFACAMQVLTFDKIYGNDFASTMCIGNIVKMSGLLVTSIVKRDKKAFKTFLIYLLVVLIFSVGAGVGYILQKLIGSYAIMVSAGLTLAASLVMFAGHNHEETLLPQSESNDEICTIEEM